MALSRKKSSLIEVAGRKFRWTVAPDDGVMNIIVQDAEGRGPKLEVGVDYYDRFRPDGPIAGQGMAITPRIVRRVIEHALHKGWKPKRSDKPMKFSIESTPEFRDLLPARDS